MLRAQGLLAKLERALVERLGLGVQALGVVQAAEVVERGGDAGGILLLGGLLDGERALIERLGATVQPLGLVDEGEVVERGADLRIILPQSLFPNLERTLKQRPVGSRGGTTPKTCPSPNCTASMPRTFGATPPSHRPFRPAEDDDRHPLENLSHVFPADPIRGAKVYSYPAVVSREPSSFRREPVTGRMMQGIHRTS